MLLIQFYVRSKPTLTKFCFIFNSQKNSVSIQTKRKCFENTISPSNFIPLPSYLFYFSFLIYHNGLTTRKLINYNQIKILSPKMSICTLIVYIFFCCVCILNCFGIHTHDIHSYRTEDLFM